MTTATLTKTELNDFVGRHFKTNLDYFIEERGIEINYELPIVKLKKQLMGYKAKTQPKKIIKVKVDKTKVKTQIATYKFINAKTNDEFVGAKKAFINAYSLNSTTINKLVNGYTAYTRSGWRCLCLL